MHTLLPRTWLRNDRLGICLAAFASIFCLPLVAADDGLKFTFLFRDAETDSPLAGARIVIDARENHHGMGFGVFLPDNPLGDPNPRTAFPDEPPMSTREHRAIADDAGGVTLSLPHPDAGMVVLHEKGVAWFPKFGQRPDGSSIFVKLQPWARLEGRVLHQGRPYPGAMIGITRNNDVLSHASFESSDSLRSTSVRHGTTAISGADGRFVFPRLLPTNIEGEKGDAPYRIYQAATTGHALMPGERGPGATFEPLMYDWPSLQVLGGEGTTNVVLELMTLSLLPGQNTKLDLEAYPHCVRKTTGRFVWPDGRPFSPLRDLPPDGGKWTAPGFSFIVRRELADRSETRYWPCSSASPEISAEGRFSVTLPLAGSWHGGIESRSSGWRIADFEFTLPLPTNDVEKDTAIDLGDIVIQMKRR